MNKPLSKVGARPLAFALTAVMSLGGVTACESGRSNERWVVTEDTRVEIDWDAVNQAYREAEGPEDLERRINEIYTGDEVVSVSVRDENETTQVVTGFFDNDGDGAVGESEKIFTIKRDIVGDGSAKYQVAGEGHYSHYRSPMWDIASGMLLGSMLSRAFMPGYSPMYTTPYTTSQARRGALVNHRNSHRAANPSKFPPKKSSSGRSYGQKGSNWGAGGARRSGGGARRGGGFGARPGRTRVLLQA